MTLSEHYHAHGVAFDYPAEWELVEEVHADAVSISLVGDATLWSLSLVPRRPSPGDVVRQVIQAYEDEYGEVDRDVDQDAPDQSACTIEFMSFELVNWARLRARREGGRTLLIVAQATDHERPHYEPVFNAMSESVTVDPDEEILIE